MNSFTTQQKDRINAEITKLAGDETETVDNRNLALDDISQHIVNVKPSPPPEPEPEWELIFEQDFEAGGIPAGWSQFGQCLLADTAAPITGLVSMLADGGAPGYSAQCKFLANSGLRHRQMRLSGKLRIELPSGGYRLIAQWAAAAGSYYNVHFNNANQLEITGRNGMLPTVHPVALVAGTVYDFQFVANGKAGQGLHSVEIAGEKVSLAAPLSSDLVFNGLTFNADWCKIWWDDLKLEGVP